MNILKKYSMQKEALLTDSGELEFPDSTNSWEALVEEESKKAFEAGHAAGFAKGYALAAQELKTSIHLIHSMTEKILDYKTNLLKKIKPEIFDIIVSISEKILRQEIKKDSVLVRVISDVINDLDIDGANASIKIFLSPEDLKRIKSEFKELNITTPYFINFISNSKLQKGDFIIDTKTEIINYQIDSLLTDIKDTLVQ